MIPFRTISLSLLSLLAACSGEQPVSQPSPNHPTVLQQDPGAALGVVAAKAAGPAAQVVVEGRVHDVTKGFAVLKLMDVELDYCGQVNKEDKCATPWDYCCDTPEDRLQKSLLVEVRGADGKPITTDVLPSARLCDLVKVRGKLEKDAFDNLVLIADGVFLVERPTLPDYIEWPQ